MKKTTSLLALLFIAAGSLFAGTWKLAKNDNGIRVYTMDIPGKSLDRFKAVATIDASLEVLVEVLRDVNNYHRWYGNCKLQRRIREYSPLESLVYHVQSVPVISNRDVIVRGKITIDYKKGTALQVMRNVKSSYKKDSGNVRMPHLRGKFFMQRITPQKTRVTYFMEADPGGSVPGWLANSTAKKQPYRTLLGLKKIVRDPCYAALAKKAHTK